MRKASDILVLIGYVIAIILGLFLIFMTVISILLCTPMSDDSIIAGIKNGTINVNVPGVDTLDQKVAYVHQTFILVSVVCFIAAALFSASATFAVLGKKKDPKYNLVSLILACLTANTILIVGEALAIASRDKQE